MIVKIESSPRPTKKYRVILSDGKHYDFGLRGSSTYLDNKDVSKREAYRKRHLGNPLEKELIQGYKPSPATFSYYLLWGDSTDIKVNIRQLNRLMKK
jgi:hypothetical protein